jgi:preprotein translocase subunit SecA
VDSILIDEARTPLIISGMVADSAKWYQTFARVAPRLTRDEDYEVEEGKYQVAVTEAGVARVEEILQIENLYDHTNTMLVHHLHNALRAKELYKRDVAYVVTQARSRSSTSSPAASWRAAVTPRACTRRSRPRKACGSKKRTRRSRRSRSRTTSSSTTSSPG